MAVAKANRKKSVQESSNTSKEDETRERVEAHIEYALRIARDFARRRSMSGIEIADFESAALLGLCDASRRFDAEKGMHFRTFAYFRIKGAMLDLLRRSGRIPRAALKRILAEKAVAEVFEREELAEMSADKNSAASTPAFPLPYAANPGDFVDLTQFALQLGIVIIPSHAEEGADLSYLNSQSPEQIAIGADLKSFLQGFIEQLPENQRRVILQRYFKDLSLEEIRESFDGVSKSWVSRLHGSALDTLRRMVDDANRAAAARVRAECPSERVGAV